MKFLLILTFCTSCLLFSCAGLRCYEGRNIGFESNETIEECSYPYMDFCITATFRNGEVPKYTCGDQEFCTTKRCYNTDYCKEPGTFERDYLRKENVTFTMSCCDTDLCNIENIFSSAKTLKKLSLNLPFYMNVFLYFYYIIF